MASKRRRRTDGRTSKDATKTVSTEEKRDRAVERQYEEYPYPPRDPEEERKRLIEGSPSQLDELNHYLFAGARDFTRPFRALIAGGGTGDATIMLAQQLADRGAAGQVTYLDMSTASRRIVEQRAKIRGLDNIEFHTGSLLDLADMGFAPFDYIECCGVLHHLENPEAGLAALTACLAEGGGLGIMLYATLGRTGVYDIQAAMKLLLDDRDTPAAQVTLLKKLMAELPNSNHFKRNPFVGDHRMGDDAALYDLLLHPRDRSYLVPEVAEFLQSSQLAAVGFIPPAKYNPATYLKDKALAARLKDMRFIDRMALGERIAGSLKTHVFYAVPERRAETAVARIAPDMVPVFLGEMTEAIMNQLTTSPELKINLGGGDLLFSMPPGAAQILPLIDGERRLSDIQTALSLDWAGFRSRFAPLYKSLNELNFLMLRAG